MPTTIRRKIPSTMATQHPDHAGRPYWHSQTFIPAVEEAKEAFLCFSELGIAEYKWDWEGKLVDESVLERLLAEQFSYFRQHPLGKEKFLTFRLPNPKVETEFRAARALLGMLTAAGLARQVGLHSPPLFEVILPMTESAKEMIAIQEAFREIAGLKHPLNKLPKNILPHIEIIPLFEQVSTIIKSDRILEKYLAEHCQRFGGPPAYLRPYVARSDPALNSGLVPTILAIKLALSSYRKFSKRHRLPLYPVIGVGTLPFRGGLNPIHPERFCREYPGIRTAIVQSAFRYDFPKRQVIRAVKLLNDRLPRGQAREITAAESRDLTAAIPLFESAYRSSVEKFAPLINAVAKQVPKRRERVQHIGLFGYNRGLGKVRLPRAISFTASLYSLGVPPELIGTGRGLEAAKRRGLSGAVERNYFNLKHDLQFAGRFLCKPALQAMAKKSPAWQGVAKDVVLLEKYFGTQLRAKNLNEQEHQLISARIQHELKKGKHIGHLIEKAAQLRKSMG